VVDLLIFLAGRCRVGVHVDYSSKTHHPPTRCTVRIDRIIGGPIRTLTKMSANVMLIFECTVCQLKFFSNRDTPLPYQLHVLMLNNAIQYFLAWWEHFLNITFKCQTKCIGYSIVTVSAGLIRVTLKVNVHNNPNGNE
jgi:hypothetical protein